MNFTKYKDITKAWAQFLDRPWKWTLTLTFRENLSPYSAKKAFDRFFKSVESDIKYFLVIEPYQFKSGAHIHSLISGLDDISPWKIMTIWNYRYGYARIYPYDKSKGARFYVSKYLAREDTIWDMKI